MNDRITSWLIASCAVVYAHIGVWSAHIQILVVLMLIDFVSGMTLAFFNKSKKANKGLKSHECREGIIRKCMVLVLVYVCHLLDKVTGAVFICDAVTICFIVSEVVSIMENARIMGIPIPQVLTKFIDSMKTKNGDGDNR